MTVFIKNMLSLESIADVKCILDKLQLSYTGINLDIVDFGDDINRNKLKLFKAAVADLGLEIIESKKMILIEKIKALIVNMILYTDELPAENYSRFISTALQHNYTYLANLFSEVQGTTIEKFIIAHKIERVKELLVYNELNLTEIAYLMHYSSVAHLSAQFKKVTGLTPSHFKQLREKRLNMLENL